MRLLHILPTLLAVLLTGTAHAEYRGPRTTDGRSGLNGVLQLLDRANWLERNPEVHP